MEFNLDKRKKFPDQSKELRYTECVAISICNICENIDGRDYDSDFVYAMTLKLMGKNADFQGSDPSIAMDAAIAYGLLPDMMDTVDPITKGQTYCADWRNYTGEQFQTALLYAKAGALPVNNDFDSVVAAMQKTQAGVHISMQWHGAMDAKYRMQMVTTSFSYHEVACYGIKNIDGIDHLIIKPWIGPNFGDGGYCYLDKTTYQNQVLGAFAFDPTAWRLYSLLSIGLKRTPYLLDTIYSFMPSQTTHGPDALYAAAKAAIGQKIAPNAIAEVGCAYCVDTIFHRVSGFYIGMSTQPEESTTRLLDQLINSKAFKEISAPQRGAICMYATGTSKIDPTYHGHVLIVGNTWLLSNTSATGIFSANYTLQSAQDYFEKKMGFSPRYFLPL